MKKEIILGLFASSLLLTSCDSSTEDPLISEDASSLSSKARKEMMWSEALTRASSVSDVQTWTGEKKIVELKNVKYALGPAYRFYIPQGVYICDKYTIVAKTPENPNIIYRNAIDDECGFLPNSGSIKTIQRGTRAVQSDDSENSYTLQTYCIHVKYSLTGAHYDIYIPCKPEVALLKYKIISLD